MFVVPNLVFDVIAGRSLLRAFNLVLFMGYGTWSFDEPEAKRHKFD